MPKGEERRRAEEIFEAIMAKNFPRLKTPNHRFRSANSKQDKYQKVYKCHIQAAEDQRQKP